MMVAQDGEMGQMRHGAAARYVCGHLGPGAEKAPPPIASQGCGTWKPCWGLVARSGVYPADQSANRKGGTTPQQDKMLQEANAVSRKAAGSHNRTDRVYAHPARGLTWSRGPVGQW